MDSIPFEFENLTPNGNYDKFENSIPDGSYKNKMLRFY